MVFMNKTEFVELFYPQTVALFQKKKYENRYSELCEYIKPFSLEQEISFDDFKSILESLRCKSASLFYEYRTMLKFILEAHGYSSNHLKIYANYNSKIFILRKIWQDCILVQN